MNPTTFIDSELGALRWDPELEWWEGSVKLLSAKPFTLYIFSRYSADGAIPAEARQVSRKLSQLELTCRRFAASELGKIQNEEWSEGRLVSEAEFAGRLIPESIVIHESGYTEFHFGDDGLFWGHWVGVRIKPDGTFQEAVVEG